MGLRMISDKLLGRPRRVKNAGTTVKRMDRARLGRRPPDFDRLEERRLLAIFTVTNTLDDGSTGSLRWAVAQANATSGANTIDFDADVFSTPQTITLSGGQLELSDTSGTQTITGPAAGVTISGGGNSRVFEVDSAVTASLSGLTISGGTVSPGDNGGGLANYGTATVTGCTLSGNYAPATTPTPRPAAAAAAACSIPVRPT